MTQKLLPVKKRLTKIPMITRETIKRLLVVLAIVIVAGVIIGYSYYASHGIIEGPTIVVTSPSADKTAFASSTVVIEGIATRTQSISLNGRPILIDEAGNFSETVILSPGYNVETLQGSDKFGHSTSVTLQLVYTPQ
jgi:hypothetical protein